MYVGKKEIRGERKTVCPLKYEIESKKVQEHYEVWSKKIENASPRRLESRCTFAYVSCKYNSFESQRRG